MTTQYTMDVNHSTLLTSPNNKQLVSSIKSLLLDDVGLANLNTSIEDESTICAIFDALCVLSESQGNKRFYKFNPRTGEHIFMLHTYSGDKFPRKVIDMFTHIPKDSTSIRYHLDAKMFALRVNSRFYPLSGVSKITSVASTVKKVFNGPVFIRRVNELRFYTDSKEVWSLPVACIKQSLSDLAVVVNADIKRYWVKTDITPPDALFITTTLLENLHALMVVVRVNYNVTKFEGRCYSDKLALEILETSYDQFVDKGSFNEFIHTAIYLTGKILERLIVAEYQHLLKGVLK